MSYVTAFKTTAFNPPSLSSGALLDGFDRELSGPTSPASGSYGVLGVNSIGNTQKKYMEFTIGAASSAVALVGFGTTSLSGTTNLGANTLGVALDGATGNVVCNGANIATPGITFTAGDVICMAIDRPNNTFWFRKNAGNWNGSGTADPATNTGGITIPATLGTGNLYLAALVKVASSVTSKVSMNVGHTAFAQTRPTGYLVWTGLTDSAYIQQIVNAAVVDRTNIVLLPVARYDCRSQISLPKGVKLMGSGRAKHSYPTGDLPNGESTVLDINWGSGANTSGDNTKAAVLLNSSAGVCNLAFNYPGQNPANNPTEWGSTIAPASGSQSWDQIVQDCFFQKAYVAIDFRGSKCGNQAIGSCVVTGNRGAPLHTGIWLDFLTDWATIRDNQFNSGWINPFADPVGDMVNWTRNNGVAARIDGNDWPVIERLSAYGYSKGVHIRPNTNYTGKGPYKIDNCDFDACEIGVYLDSQSYYDVAPVITGCRFACFNVDGNVQGWPLQCGPLGADGIIFEGNVCFASTAGVVDASAASYGLLSILNNQITGGPGGSVVAFSLGSGPTYVAGNRLNGFI